MANIFSLWHGINILGLFGKVLNVISGNSNFNLTRFNIMRIVEFQGIPIFD